MERAKSDPQLTHIFVPRPDRLARPGDPMDGMRLENEFRLLGKTLVYMSKVLEPVKRGNRPNPGEAILSYLDFDRASGERRVLSEKIILSQIILRDPGTRRVGKLRTVFAGI